MQVRLARGDLDSARHGQPGMGRGPHQYRGVSWLNVLGVLRPGVDARRQRVS